jgi:hypothetical protein
MIFTLDYNIPNEGITDAFNKNAYASFCAEVCSHLIDDNDRAKKYMELYDIYSEETKNDDGIPVLRCTAVLRIYTKRKKPEKRVKPDRPSKPTKKRIIPTVKRDDQIDRIDKKENNSRERR